MGIFGKVQRWRKAKIEETRRAAEERHWRAEPRLRKREQQERRPRAGAGAAR